MAVFTNQATLTYGSRTVSSNVVQGEVTEVLTVTKTAVQNTYNQGERITYTVSILNAGTTPFTGLSVADDLGAYAVGTTTVVPLTYEEGSVQYYQNGVLQTAPGVTEGQNVVFSGLTVPAGGNALLVYTVTANQYADPNADGTVTNTVSVTGGGLVTPVTASAEIASDEAPYLTIQKSVSPNPVVENGTLTYTFLIQNTGALAADAGTGATVQDTFNPILSGVTATYNGTPLTVGSDYRYNTSTGYFGTATGVITVPRATYTQDPTTGLWSTTPGTGTLVVSGTV